MFPFRSFSFCFSFRNVSTPFLSFFLLLKCFPFFHSFHSQFPWLLTFIYFPILYYEHPIPSTPLNRPLPWNPHPHLPHPHAHSPPRSTPDPPFPFLSPRTRPYPHLQPPCPAPSPQPNRYDSRPP